MAKKVRSKLLQKRNATHGDFADNARISQAIKTLFWKEHEGKLSDIHMESLAMIALKLSRILSGHANFKDHWTDIAGYAKLAEEACD